MVLWGIEFPVEPWRPIFENSSHLWEKGGVLIFFPGLYGALYGQNFPYKFKKSYGGAPEPQTPQDAPWLRGPSLKIL